MAAISLGSIGLAIAIAEVALRSIDYPRHACRRIDDAGELRVAQFDPELGWSYVPHHSAIADHRARYTFSRAGYRAAGLETVPDASLPMKVLLVGDSMLFGHGLEFEDTVGVKLQKRLNARAGAGHEVLNFAVQAYGTDQSYLMLRRVIDRFGPRAVIVDFIGEHLLRNVSGDRRELFPCLRFLGTKPLFGLEDGRLTLRTRPERFEAYDHPRLRLLLRRALAGSIESRAARSGVAVSRALLGEIQRLCAERGARLLLLSFAAPAETNAVNPGIPAVVVEWERPENRRFFISDRDHHPNATGTTMLVDELLETGRAAFTQEPGGASEAR